MPSPTQSLRVVVLAHASSGLEASIRSAKQFGGQVLVACACPIDAERVRVIAERNQAQMVKSVWSDNLSQLRNDAMRQAGGDWVLWLEDGETLTPASVDGIRQRLDGQLEAGCIYYLAVQVADCATSTTEQRAEPRLLPNRPGLRYSGRVAEDISRAVTALALNVDGLPERIDGRGREDKNREMDVATLGVCLCELEVQQHGPTARVLNQLGEFWETLKQIDEALGCYEQSVEIAEKGSTDQRRAFHGLIGLAEGKPERQIEICQKAIEHFPMDMPILCVMAMALQILNQTELALRCYATAYKFGQIAPELWHTDQLRDYAVRCYALLLRITERTPEALDVLEEGYNQGLQSDALCRQLLHLYVHQGRTKSALELADTLPLAKAELAPLRAAIRGGCLVAQQNWIAARPHLEGAYRAGCVDNICLRSLALCYLGLRLGKEAEDVLLHWMNVEPGNGEAKLFLKAAREVAPASQESRKFRIDVNQQERGHRQPAPVDLSKSTAPRISTQTTN